MTLEKYNKKRKFNLTPEPSGVKLTRATCPEYYRGKPRGVVAGSDRFVIQEHHARNLHYDFRLELPEKWDKGSIVLKSWAVPKGMPEKSGIKHLAIQTEDHPIEYIDFKGIIPEGNYGAGEVKIWDRGKYKNIKFQPANWRAKIKMIEFTLAGKKLKGDYVMIKTSYGKNSWLIFKK